MHARSSTLFASALALALVAYAPLGQAQDQDQGSTAAPQMLVRDAKTGRMRPPTAQESESMLAESRAAAKARPKLQPLSHPSGAIGFQAGEDMAGFIVVSRTPDGKLVENCVESKSQAEEMVKTGKMPAAPQQAPSK